MPPVPPAAQDPYPGRRADRDLRLAKPRPELSRQNEARAPPGRVYTFDTLCEKGISFSKNHIRRLVAAGGFPPPFYMSERRPAWSEAALDEWISEREIERDREPVQPGRASELQVGVGAVMVVTTKPNLDENAGSSKRRKVFDRIPLGDDELVVSLDDRDRIDMRLWTATGGVRMASANGLTLHRNALSKLLDALRALSGEEVS